MKRAAVMVLLVIGLWSFMDYAVWGRIFDANWYRLSFPFFERLDYETVDEHIEFNDPPDRTAQAKAVDKARAYYAKLWHWALSDLLVGLIAMGSILLVLDRQLRAVAWFAVVTWPLANSGLEDALYYCLAGSPVPSRLEWLDEKYWAVVPVTPVVIAVSVLVHVIAAGGLWLLIQKVRLPDGIRSLLQQRAAS